jgi:hypothetical protein
MWTQRTLWYFATLDSRAHFVIRPRWGERIIVDLPGARVVPNVGDMARRLDDLERQHVVFILNTGAGLRARSIAEVSAPGPHDSFTAAWLAGRWQLKEALPALRELQKSTEVSSSGGHWDLDLKDGEINPMNCSQFGLRRCAQLSLRRLGQVPGELPCTAFRFYRQKELGPTVTLDPLPAPRAQRVDLLRDGMSPLEVLQTVGPPDWITFSERSWEFDIDDTQAYTLRLIWESKPYRISKIQRLKPPTWNVGETSDEALDH